MRKFTKEIAALLSTLAVGASMGAGYASSEESVPFDGVDMPTSEDIVRTEGVAINPEVTATTVTTTIPPLSGEATTADTTTVTTTTTEMPPTISTQTTADTYTTTTVTTTEDLPPYIGTQTETTTTTTSIPPLMGTITTTSSTTTAIPPFIGTETTVTTTTTIPTETTTEEIPPLMGEIAIPDGDVNGDGEFNIADVVTFQRYILNSPDVKNYYWDLADMNNNGKIDVFDLILMKRAIFSNWAQW